MKLQLVLLLCIISFLSLGQGSETMNEEVIFPDLLSEKDAQLLAALKENPVEINEADLNELSQIPFLSIIQVRNLIDYRSKYGKLISLYELQAVPGFDVPTIRNIAPFISFGFFESSKIESYIPASLQHRLILNFETLAEKTAGFKTRRYLGDPYKMNGRYRFKSHNDLNIGLTFEKDAGEQLSIRSEDRIYGFDHYSGFIQKEFQEGWLREIIIGDFTVHTGQGLALGMGFSFGKGSETIASVKKNPQGIRPYTSLAETGYFRGLGATFIIGPRVELFPFISVRRCDATVLTGNTISGFTESGYHRTANELNKKKNTQVFDLGLSLQYSNLKKTFSSGYSMIYTHVNRTIAPNPEPYNSYYFRGSENLCQSLYVEGLYNNISYFGEGAVSKSQGTGLVTGMILSLSEYIDVSLLLRNYDKNFQSFYADAFSESSQTQNEKGVYQGIKLKPFQKLLISAYADIFRFPWIKYGVSSPSSGKDYLVKTDYSFSRHSSCYFQYRYSEKEQDFKTENTPTIGKSQFQQYQVSIKTGSEFVSFNSKAVYNIHNNDKGIALINDLNIKINKHGFSLRMALFDAENYETRIYTYEKDLLYSYSFPAYYGKGLRAGLNAKFNLHKNMVLRFKIARFSYFGALSTGTGDQKIEGNRKTDIKFQLYLRF